MLSSINIGSTASCHLLRRPSKTPNQEPSRAGASKTDEHLELTNDCPRNETLTGEDGPRSNNRLQVNPPDHGSAIVIDDSLWSAAADGPSHAVQENRPWGQWRLS